MKFLQTSREGVFQQAQAITPKTPARSVAGEIAMLQQLFEGAAD
jgi:hypothetical protein